MRNLFKIIIFVCIVFVISGCGVNLFDLPESSDFDKSDSLTYQISTSNNLTIEADSCNSRIEVINYDGSDVLVDIYYNDKSEYDKIDLDYNDDKLTIKREQALNWGCWLATKVKTYIKISIPNTTNEIDLDFLVAHADLNIDSLNAEKLNYKNVNGNIEISNSQIDNLNTEIINGTIDINSTTGKSLFVKNVNNNVEVNNVNFEDKVTTKLTNGNIEVINIDTLVLDINNVNGNITLEDANVSNSTQIDNINGRINVTNVNLDIINDITNTKLTANVTNGNIDLNNVYCQSVDLTTINGDISYINENQDFEITDLEYHQTNGDSHFDINAVIKND